MHVSGEALLVGDALQQIAQGGALVFGEGGEERSLMLAGGLSDGGEHLASLVGEGEGMAAAVVGAAAALGEAEGVELVEQRDEAAGHHPEGACQRLLGKARRCSQDMQDAGVRGREAEFRDAFAETARRVATDLGEEKGRPESGLGGRPRPGPVLFFVFHRVYCCTGESFCNRTILSGNDPNRRFPMSTSVTPPRIRHQGPPLWLLASIYTVLFLIGLWKVTIFGGKPYFPGPWEPASTIVAFFQTRPGAAEFCSFFHFGAAIALGLFTATAVNQMRFLGVRAAGINIALFGGLATVFGMFVSAFSLWTLARPGIAQDPTVTTALYYLGYAFGGPGFSVPLGLLIAGLSIPAAFTRLLPKWLTIFGIALGVCGELSWLNLIVPKALFLIPLTRFPGFIWLIAAGILLPRTVAAGKGRMAVETAAF